MSQDLRRKVAYFGPREKVYPKGADPEVPGLPFNWRRILCMSWPFPVAGPCGNVYADAEHAIAAFRAHYTTNNPALANLFRPEHEAFRPPRVCRRWSTNNGLSLLLSDPDDRVWFVVRDRCMFDLVYQRVCRDEVFRRILAALCDRGYLPVYHVRTADAQTYWGAIIDRSKLNLTTSTTQENSSVNLSDLARERAEVWSDNPGSILVGKNRLGYLMKAALEQYRLLYDVGMQLRAKVPPGTEVVPALPLSQIVPPLLPGRVFTGPLEEPPSPPRGPPCKRPRATDMDSPDSPKQDLSPSRDPPITNDDVNAIIDDLCDADIEHSRHSHCYDSPSNSSPELALFF